MHDTSHDREAVLGLRASLHSPQTFCKLVHMDLPTARVDQLPYLIHLAWAYFQDLELLDNIIVGLNSREKLLSGECAAAIAVDFGENVAELLDLLLRLLDLQHQVELLVLSGTGHGIIHDHGSNEVQQHCCHNQDGHDEHDACTPRLIHDQPTRRVPAIKRDELKKGEQTLRYTSEELQHNLVTSENISPANHVNAEDRQDEEHGADHDPSPNEGPETIEETSNQRPQNPKPWQRPDHADEPHEAQCPQHSKEAHLLALHFKERL
mmetsp:Transcript_118099/g.252367  ORF Transcript_118099/g.252367 Transcript_118099/m.252367 type:complete len:265 (+) Transcript_118099:344-1138(+)